MAEKTDKYKKLILKRDSLLNNIENKEIMLARKALLKKVRGRVNPQKEQFNKKRKKQTKKLNNRHKRFVEKNPEIISEEKIIPNDNRKENMSENKIVESVRGRFSEDSKLVEINKEVVQDKKPEKVSVKEEYTQGRSQSNKISKEVKEIAENISKIKKEIAKVVVGQEEVINAFICAMLCDGHVLLEGVPGIAKTLIVKTLAAASGCSSNRVQFTVDLLPSDILGVTTYTPQKGFETLKGPIFANFIVADEINRSPPKTQSALIEAMQEKQVTIGKNTFKLPTPFFVMANNNPLEVGGVYSLPEAQIDRFLFKLIIGYPKETEEEQIMEENITIKKFEDFKIKSVFSPQKILKMQKKTKEIYIDDKIKNYIVRLIDKTRKKDFPDGEYIEWGGSPRASIGLYIASKAWALMNGRDYVIPKDVKDIAHYVLRHRIILNYRAKAEKIDSDKIIEEILDMVEV